MAVNQTSRFAPYLYVAPLVALLLFVFGYPLVRIFEFSFKMVRGIDGPWIGWRNYELVLNQPLFWESVRHNVLLLLAVPFMVAWSLLIAVVLYERLRAGSSTASSCSCPTSSRFRSSPSS